jgi:hypothetical protein
VAAKVLPDFLFFEIWRLFFREKRVFLLFYFYFLIYLSHFSQFRTKRKTLAAGWRLVEKGFI